MSPDDLSAFLTAVYACDASADGRFWYGVTSTRIYCRPSCPSRAPRRERIRIFASPAEAEDAGFRPCKRCTPDEPHAGAEAARRMEEAAAFLRCRVGGPVRWQDAAAHVFLSPSRFHRLFRAHHGLPPGAYLARLRAAAARELRARGEGCTRAALAAGFGSMAAYYRAGRRFPVAEGIPGAAIRPGSVGERKRR